MADFKIVEVPSGPTNGTSGPIIDALLQNIGKALEIPLETKNSNTFRKTLRAAANSRNLLLKYNFRTVVSADNKALIVWLEPRPTKEGTGAPQT